MTTTLEIAGSSSDIGSGLTFAHRPGLFDFHAAPEDGTVDILLLVDLARLSRDLDKTMQHWYLLRNLKISIYTVNSGDVNLSIATMLRKIIEE